MKSAVDGKILLFFIIASFCTLCKYAIRNIIKKNNNNNVLIS